MRYLLVILICSTLLLKSVRGLKDSGNEVAEDDDFAEFDEDDEEVVLTEKKVKESKAAVSPSSAEDDEADVANEPEEEDEGEAAGGNEEEEGGEEEEEFSHFEDEEEFEGYHQDNDEFENKKREDPTSAPPPPKTINITKIPAHLHTNWENYYLEIIMICGIIIYFINFVIGKSRNQKIAQSWFDAHRSMLESSFTMVGDDGAEDIKDIKTRIQQDSLNTYTLWCSGRNDCEGMLVELKLLKRQDLLSVISAFIKSSCDQLHIRVNMGPNQMGRFVLALAQKKTALRMAKELIDISTYTKVSKPELNFPQNYRIMAETGQAITIFYGSPIYQIFQTYPNAIDYIHFSDQYLGQKPTDDQAALVNLPEGQRVLMFNFNLSIGNKNLEEAVEDMKPLMSLALYFIEKMKRFGMSTKNNQKAIQNRCKFSEAFFYSHRFVRLDNAQKKKERRRQEINERILEIEDPDKQRKLKDREDRRVKKKNAPKMKQLKVKAMH